MEHHHYIGLTDAEVLKSRQEHGVNILTPPVEEPLWKKFFEKFSDPLIIILLIAGGLSLGISCYEYWGLEKAWSVFFEPIGIFVAILLATGIAFIFELNADKKFAVLNQVNDDELIKVIRNGNTIRVPKKDIVVDDIVILSTGDEVPADGDLVEAVTLLMDESTLTGEASCHKSTNAADFDREATYPTNYVLRGTKVLEGHGIFHVLKVGDNTENGKVFKEAQIDDSVKTPLNEQLDRLSDLITKISYAFAALIIVAKILVYFHWAGWAWLTIVPVSIFFYLLISDKLDDFKNGWKIFTIIAAVAAIICCVLLAQMKINPGQEPAELLAYTMEAIMIAVTLIVVAVPEGLPLAVTLSLAYSMKRMLETNNLVRKMHACETMGAATFICTDKTGTLTQNQMKIYRTNFYALSHSQLLGYDEMSQLIIEGIVDNSTATLDYSGKQPQVVGSPTEGASLLWLNEKGIDVIKWKENLSRLEEVPFSTINKYMAIVVRSVVNNKRILYVNGAPEIVLSLCNKIEGGLQEVEVKKQLLAYQEQAMRTLGFAYQILDEDEEAIKDGKVVAKNLIFMGIVAISDPVREDVPAAVRECLDAGINVKIVTGDTSGTAKEVGRQIGLWNESDNESNIITGPEFAKMTDEQLQKRVKDLKIISRARPTDKQRLVKALQANNEVVAVTGDGTNDAPALNAAHVGLSMGDGTSVAKEASDITIIDNSFSSIGRAVMWGRSLFQNIQRFLLFQLTVNVAACFLVLVGSFTGTESPLTVTQMLWVNLIMDTFGAMALASLPPTKKVMKDKPRDRNAFIINKQMAWNIFGVGGFFFLLLLVLLVIFQHADITCMQDLLSFKWGSVNQVTPYEQTLLFSIFVWTHFWYMFDARGFETGRSALHFKGCKGFGIITAIIVIGQILIVEVAYDFFNVVPMKVSDWFWIIVLSSLVLWAREIYIGIHNLFHKEI
jgi:Ca2+-transporting ATPase